MNFKLCAVIVGVCVLASDASAQWWAPIAFGRARNIVGSQIRHASPEAYQVLLGVNRSIPPQYKNGGFAPFVGGVAPHYGGGGYGYSPYQADLAYWRSIPPQVKNEWAKQQRLAAMQVPVQIPYAPPSATQPGAPIPAPNSGPSGGLPFDPTIPREAR